MKISVFAGCARGCVAAALLAGCNASTHSNQQQHGSSSPAASEPALSAVAVSPGALRDYAAVDYDKPGHPPLAPTELASIRSALARVKPCQRTLVRYALLAYPAELPFVIFFQPEGTNDSAPVFGEPRTYYRISEGEVITASPTDPYADQIEKFGIEFLIDHQSCAPVPR
jgi:hypothetical protein